MTSPKATSNVLLVRASDRATMTEDSFRHPLNVNSELHGYDLSRAVGFARTGLMLARVPPGRESFAPRSHAAQEEWLFVLSGRAFVDIGDEVFPIGVGDFAGFPAGAPAHHLRNPGPEDLVYLCGGERTDLDVIDYPSAGRVVVRHGGRATVYPAGAGEPLFK